MEYCKNCGKPIKGGICENCGTHDEVEQSKAKEESAAAASATRQASYSDFTEEPRKKKAFYKTPIFIGLIILLIAASAVTATLVMKKTPRERYLLAEYNTYQEAIEEMDEKNGGMNEILDKLAENPSGTTIKLSGDVQMDSMQGDPQFEMIRALLKQANIVAKVDQDSKNNKVNMNLALNLNGEKAVDLQAFQDEKHLGVKVPMLFDNFFYINADEYGKLMKQIDPSYNGPEKLEFRQISMEDLELSDGEEKYLKDRYTKFLLDNLKDEQFTEKKGVDYKYKGETLKLREVTLNMSSKETKAFLTEFFDQLEKDKKLHNMIAKRYGLLVDNQAFPEDESMITKDELKEELPKRIKEMKEEIKDSKTIDGFKSKLLLDNDDIIVDRQSKLVLKENDETITFSINQKNVEAKDDKRYEYLNLEALIDEGKDMKSKYAFEFANNSSLKKDNLNSKMEINLLNEPYDDEPFKGIFTMDSKIKGDYSGKLEANREFNLIINDGDSGTKDEYTGTLKSKRNLNKKSGLIDQNYVFNFDIPDNANPGNITVNMDYKSEMQDKIATPSMKDTVDKNISKLTDEDMALLEEQLQIKIMELGQKFGLFDMGADYEEAASF